MHQESQDWEEANNVDLNEYQRLASQTDQQPETGTFDTDPRSILVPLLGLAGEVGELLGEHKKWLRDGNSYVDGLRFGHLLTVQRICHPYEGCKVESAGTG